MEREHLIIVAILALVLFMLMKHSGDCNCSGCMKDKMVNMPSHIRTRRFADCLEDPSACNGPPGPSSHIRTRYDGEQDKGNFGQHIRYSDKYIGAGQHIKNHIRYDSRQGMFNGLFSGSPQHIREGFCSTDAGCESAPGGCCM